MPSTPGTGLAGRPELPPRLSRLFESPLLRLVLVAGLLALLAGAVDPAAMRDALSQARWSLILPAVLILPVQYLASGWLWQALARTIDPDLSIGESMRAILGSLSVAIWTPARAGDFAARPTLMSRGSKRSLAAAVGAENLLRLPVPLALAGGASFWLDFPASTPFGWICLLVAALSLAPFFFPDRALAAARRVRIDRHVGFLEALTPRLRRTLVWGHGARYVLLSGQFALIALAMPGPAAVGPASVMAACLVILAAKLVAPLLNFAELGIREGASVVVFGALGYTTSAALQASLLVFAINVLLPAAVGAVFWLRRSR